MHLPPQLIVLIGAFLVVGCAIGFNIVVQMTLVKLIRNLTKGGRHAVPENLLDYTPGVYLSVITAAVGFSIGATGWNANLWSVAAWTFGCCLVGAMIIQTILLASLLLRMLFDRCFGLHGRPA